MKTIALVTAVALATLGFVGCATHAAVNTPIVDVGAGGSVGR